MPAIKIAPSRMRLVDGQGFATPEFFRILQALQERTGGISGVLDALAVASNPTGDVAATNVQAAIAELASEKATVASLNAHLADTIDAHDASAISNVPAGSISATDVQGALNELDAEKVPATRTVNGHALSADVTVSASDVGAPSGSGTSTGTNTGDQFTATTASRLLGRGSASGAGAAQELTIGSGLTLTGTNLTAAGTGGTVTTVSVVSANGFAGTVATPGSTPAITLTTSLAGLLKGNGTAMSAATAGTDYVAPGGALGTPSSGNLASCTFPTLNQNTTGSAAKWTTPRNLAGNSVDGSANVAFANPFIVQGTADAGLSAAQFLGALATGIVKNTTTTGVLSIAVAGTDYYAPGSTDVALADGGTGASAAPAARTNLGYVAGSFTATGTGFTVAPTCTVFYEIWGQMVVCHIVGGVSGTSSATGLTLTGWPAAITPARTQNVIARVADNGGASVYALAQVNTTNIMTFFATAAGGSFTAAGTKTLASQTFSYLLS
jgi:hypothetical protein